MSSPAQPFINWRDKLIDAARKLESYDGPVSSRKPDTSWHDEMVRKANQSFRAKAENDSKTRPVKSTSRKRKPYKTAQ